MKLAHGSRLTHSLSSPLFLYSLSLSLSVILSAAYSCLQLFAVFSANSLLTIFWPSEGFYREHTADRLQNLWSHADDIPVKSLWTILHVNAPENGAPLHPGEDEHAQRNAHGHGTAQENAKKLRHWRKRGTRQKRER